MPTGDAKFQAAANEAGCAFLLGAGGTAAQVATYSLLTGNLVVGAGAAIATGLAAYAYANSCQWDQDASGPTTPPPFSGCKKFSSGGGYWYINDSTQPVWDEFGLVAEVTFYEYTKDYSDVEPHRYVVVWLNPSGTQFNRLYTPSNYVELQLRPEPGAVCEESFEGGPTPIVPPHVYTDPDDGCEIKVTLQGLAMDSDGSVSPVWLMEPNTPPARATGGLIGGCNFTPIIYYKGPGGPVLPPVPPTPVPGPDGEPWWVPLVQGALRGVASYATEQLLEKLFTQNIPQWQYTMRAACNYKQDGTYEEYTITLPEAPYQERMLQLAETQLDFLQQHLLWKTPTCGGGGQSVSGDPVSINWVSDDYSPVGNDRIRKLLTYFDQNNTSLEATVDHWKDFSFEAGPVVVSCAGTLLGKPQVWASSLAEAQRVIGHAAAIAGVDLTNAEWMTGSPRSGRYGQTGTMRVAKDREGYFAITKRPGPSGPTERLRQIPTPGSG